jgi:hypothetical protein
MVFDGENLGRQITGSTSDQTNGPKKYKVDIQSGDLPTSFDVGVTYQYKLDDESNISFDLTGSVMSQLNEEISQFGMEYSFNSLKFRGGYDLSSIWIDDSIRDFSLGFGLEMESGENLIKFDYAYQNIKITLIHLTYSQ